MEVRLVVFLAFASVTVVTNTVMIFLAYKALSGISSKVSTTVADFQKNSEIRQWIDSLQIAAERAVVVTQATKETIADFEPVITRAQENYSRAIAVTDSKLNQVADQVTTSAKKVRDTVAKPAFSVAAFVAGITKVFETFQSRE